ncbi:MAG: CHAT domain-containing protein, partial [Chloroflexia bacterium]|nr:CHAT domain-containing protein [Chloroflexia bacterium]
ATADPVLREHYETLTGRERALRDALGRPEDDPFHRPYYLVREELASLREELRRLQEGLLATAGIETGPPSPGAVQALPLLRDGRTGLLSLAVTEHGTLALLLTARGLRQTVVPGLTEAGLRAMVQGPDKGPERGGCLGAYLSQLETLRTLRDAIRRTVGLRALVQRPDEAPGWGGWLGSYLSQLEALRTLRDAIIWAALLPGSQEHHRAAEEARAAWQAAREHWRHTITETLAALGRDLWPPLEGMLQDAGCQRVVLAPQGMLFLLPLHACPLNGKELLCDRYTVAYTPAGAILPQLTGKVTGVDMPHSLVVANPTGDLRHTPSEALAVGQALGHSITLWEGEATQAAVVAAAREADILHVSGHGRYDWREPEHSGLLLAIEGSVGENEHKGALFTVADMRDELRLSRARLVTLSACETGLVDFRRGLADEYLGLPGILLQAGARAVVASLWAVDDLATTLLMRQFYTEWQAGALPIAIALQRAQAWLRTRSRVQVQKALAELDEIWEPWRHQATDPAMQRRAIDQYWEIRAAQQRVQEEMPDPPFAHPYWWAAFQAVGDVL